MAHQQLRLQVLEGARIGEELGEPCEAHDPQDAQHLRAEGVERAEGMRRGKLGGLR